MDEEIGEENNHLPFVGSDEKKTNRLSSASSSNNSGMWRFLGRKVPRNEIVFCCQMLVVFVVVGVSLYNISTNHPQLHLWTILLSSSLGYVLPNPRLETKVIKIRDKNNHFGID